MSPCAERVVGLAHSDKDLIEFLRRAGLEDADMILDDPHLSNGAAAARTRGTRLERALG